MAKQLPKRSEIDAKYKWQLNHIFDSQEAWEQALQEVDRQIAQVSALIGTVAEQPEQAIRAAQSLEEAAMPVLEYAFLAREVDNGDPQAQANYERAMALSVRLSTATAFIAPELLTLDEQRLRELAADPALSDYSEQLRLLLLQKPHTLPKEQEFLLARLGEVHHAPENVFDMLTNVDIRFPDITHADGSREALTEGTYSTFIHHPDREVRRQAFEGLMQTYGSYGATLAATYGASVKKDVALASIRNYPSALAAAMDPLEIPQSVYDNLIDVIHEYLPVLQEYLQLRKQVMGLDQLHMYDLYVPIVSDFDMKLPYSEAFDLVLEGLKPMGEDYLAKLREARDGGWIDVFPSQNKSSGAFSAGDLASVHPYVLLNHNDNIDSAFTIAHELGHSMHSYFSNTAQPAPKRGYSLFVAEVASTCNEATMMRYLLEKFTDKKAKAYLLNYFLEQFRTTCVRQTMFAEFERKVHEMAQQGEPLTNEALSKVYYELNELYYGGSCTVDQQIANEWMRIPHFYNAFYVYVYATGLCAAVALSDRILREGEEAVTAYRRFLSAGSSVAPIEALKLVGIDMSKPEPLRQAMEVFRQTLTQFRETIQE